MNTAASNKYEASRVRKYQLDLSRYYHIPAVQSSLNVVMSLFVAAFFILFALRPTFVTIVKLQKTIADSEVTLKTLETKVSALQRASKALEALTPALPMIEASVPSKEAGYAPFVSTLEVLAAQNEVVLTTSTLGETVLYSRIFSPFAPNKNQAVVSLPFAAQVVGSYSAVTQFLRQVMSMDRIVNIESLTYAREGTTRGSTISATSLTITGEAYYLADQAQLLKALPETKKGGK
jgi:Tfp pilus assembly protein PilO